MQWAAGKIQRAWRGYAARRKAASTIQRAWRTYRAGRSIARRGMFGAPGHRMAVFRRGGRRSYHISAGTGRVGHW